MTLKRRFSLSPKVWFAAFGIALLLTLGWVATQSGPLAPIQVTVAPVVLGDVSPALFGIGTVEARRAYLIGPTSAGRVRRVLVDVGDTVTAGQLLAEMEPVDLDTRVAAAVAAAERGRSTVDGGRGPGARRPEPAGTWPPTEARRTEALGQAGAASQSAVDSARQARAVGRGAGHGRRSGAGGRPAGRRPGWTPTPAARNNSGATFASPPRWTASSRRVTRNQAPPSLRVRPSSAGGSPQHLDQRAAGPGPFRGPRAGCRPSSRGAPTRSAALAGTVVRVEPTATPSPRNASRRWRSTACQTACRPVRWPR